MLFDTHCHTYFPELADRQDELIADMTRHDVRYAVQIGCDVETSTTCIEYARRYEPYYATVGYHPSEAQDLREDEIHEKILALDKLIAENRDIVVAVGECGLDYYHIDTSREAEQKRIQELVFRAQVALAKRWDLRIVIHMRNARREMIRLIRELDVRNCLIHCFSEDASFMEELRAFSDEIYFSFSGIVTYPKATNVQEAARKTPLDRILVETDAPFLSPQTVRGTLNSPANVRYVLETIKHLRPEDNAEVERTIFKNSMRFYGLLNNRL